MTEGPAGMGLPLRQQDTYSDTEDEPRQASQAVASLPYVETSGQDDDRPERETHHATGGEETDAEGCIRRAPASDRRPDGVQPRLASIT
jgi:hypothetical protein